MSKKKRPEQLSWTQDFGGRELRVTALGCKRALVENHSGIAEYALDKILIRCKRGMLTLHGQSLALREVRKDALIVTGTLSSVEFPNDSAEN